MKRIGSLVLALLMLLCLTGCQSGGNQAELEANIAEALEKNPDSTYGMDTLNGYSKSKAKADDALDNVGYATIVIDKKTNQVVSYEDDFE